jgi:hypothetical protein
MVYDEHEWKGEWPTPHLERKAPSTLSNPAFWTLFWLTVAGLLAALAFTL